MLALAGIAATGLFLVATSSGRERFYYLFTRPQWRSWLALGAQVINLAGARRASPSRVAAAARRRRRCATCCAGRWCPAGALLAGYTAFLFGQCEGRDLWQSPLLLPHTIVNAIVAGAAALGIARCSAPRATDTLGWALAGSSRGRASRIDRASTPAARTRPRRPSARRATCGATASPGASSAGIAGSTLGALLPLGGQRTRLLLAAAGVLALAGLWLYEDAWVRAGQSVPLS